jgi:hypothetical protein
METPIPALIPRGTRSFLWSKETMGSADTARSIPRRKGENKGKRNRIASQNRKNSVYHGNILLKNRDTETVYTLLTGFATGGRKCPRLLLG